MDETRKAAAGAQGFVSKPQFARMVAVTMLLFGVFVANFFYWIDFTLSRELSGFAFSPFGYTVDHPKVVVLSFGVLFTGLILLASAACWMQLPRIQYLAAAFAVFLVVWAVARLGLSDTNMLIELSRESTWWSVMLGRPSPQSQMEPDVWSQLSFETVFDRVYSCWYYLGLGWYAALVTSLGAMVGARAAGRAFRWRGALATVAVAGLILALSLVRPIEAQRSFTAGVRAQTLGEAARAINDFRRAVRIDRWYAMNPRVYERIGALQAGRGQTDQPEYNVYLAERLFANNQFSATIGDLPTAIASYERLASRSDDLGAVARIRVNDLRLILGWHLVQGGAFGQALQVLEQVSRDDPNNWLAPYYLGVVYPTMSRYQDLKEVTQRFLERCGDPLIIGILYANLGDAETWLGNYDAAHQAYYQSYYQDYMFNSRGATAASGPGVQ
jgi:tetratricopeptide (TPR) repeat protein